MAISAFISEDASAVDRLVDACKIKVVSEADIVERLLVPYFADVASDLQAALDMQRKIDQVSGVTGRKNNRSGSPSSGSDTSVPSSGSARTPSRTPKGSRPVKAARATPTLSPVPSRAVAIMSASRASSPPNVSPLAAAAASSKAKLVRSAPAVAACPAMFTSPKPSALPMPSSALFARRVSFVGLAIPFNLAPMALPMMAVA